MRTRTTVLLTAAAVTVAGFLTPTSPAAASGTVTLTSQDGGQATVTIADTTFLGAECRQVPFTVDFRLAPGDPVASVELKGYLPGSNEDITGFKATFDGSGVKEGTMQVCPYPQGPGTYNVTVTFSNSITQPDIVSAPFPVTIAPGPSTATVTAKVSGARTVVTGTATTTGERGPVGIRGSYVLQSLTPKSKGGSGKWVNRGYANADQFGKFKETLTKVPKGSTVRLTVKGLPAGYCDDVTVTTTVR